MFNRRYDEYRYPDDNGEYDLDGNYVDWEDDDKYGFYGDYVSQEDEEYDKEIKIKRKKVSLILNLKGIIFH